MLAGGAATGDAGTALGQQLCQRALRAPPGQRVRLELAGVAVAQGAFLFAFDGTTQEVELTPEALVGNAKVDLKLALFNSVGELTLLIEGNHADEEETIINSLALWGSVIEIVGKRNDAPHLGKWSEDGGIEQYEKNASKK